ncbi:MAG: peptidyl-alpha-hydroxyglycine alpha-amidating lyase family protein [Candidatus Poribacteria bacterium]|nr:peptidyl-alpha-hydroxyglycine alpha-amidating lyase family protein [Candidatus Poribacteria bacterium]
MTYGSGNYRYEVVEGWGQIPQLGLASGVACDSQDRVYVFNRQPQPAMLVFERGGTFLTSWGADIFKKPHGIWISPNDEIYTTDTEDHTVRKFSLSGELLQTLGTVGQPGPPGQPFNQPTRALLSQSGDLYVSDGYGQSRVHRLTPDGEVIVSWGAPGTGPGEFNLPHDVTVDKNDRVYILDRGNLRCQIFNANGEYLTEWGDLRSPNDLFIDQDDVIHIAEGGQRITVMTLEGEIITQWGEKGTNPGQFSDSPHGIWIDSHGDIYVSEVVSEKRLQKFVRV